MMPTGVTEENYQFYQVCHVPHSRYLPRPSRLGIFLPAEPEPMSTPQSLRERLYIMVFQTDTVAGRRFDKILLLIILASLVTVILDSIDEVHQGYAGLLAGIEWGFTAIFLAEYLTRLYCSPKPLRYAFSFMAWSICWRSCRGSSRCTTATPSTC